MQTYYNSSLTGDQIEKALLASKKASEINGLVKYNGSGQGTVSVSQAVANTDYLAPSFFKTLTVTLDADSWDSSIKEQTVEAEGVTDSNIVIVTATATDIAAYSSAKIVCTAQDDDELTFQCNTIPTDDIEVNVLVIG